MNAPSAPDGRPVALPPDEARRAHTGDRAPGAVSAACPYLAVDERAWRSATADRAHRCTAVVPPAALALDKQRRLCLGRAHTSCATFLAAASAHPIAAAAGDGDSRGRVTRWALTRTTPVVLDHGRVPALVATLSPFRRGGQVALGGLVVIALAAVLAPRLSAPDGRPAGAAEPSAGASGTSSATVAPSPTPRPSRSSTPSPSNSATPSPTPAPTQAPTPVIYVVKSGDTLSAIAGRFGTTVAAIQALNGIADPSRLRIGQVLQIPVSP